MKDERIILVAGPRRGKSTMAGDLQVAHRMQAQSIGTRWPEMRIFCGDPLSKVKEPRKDVTYMPEGIHFAGDGGAAEYVASEWFPMPGPWVCEGHVMARALRRWLTLTHVNGARPADRIIVLDRPGFGIPSKGQDAMHKGVMTVWDGIAREFEHLTEHM